MREKKRWRVVGGALLARCVGLSGCERILRRVGRGVDSARCFRSLEVRRQCVGAVNVETRRRGGANGRAQVVGVNLKGGILDRGAEVWCWPCW